MLMRRTIKKARKTFKPLLQTLKRKRESCRIQKLVITILCASLA